MTRKTLGAGVAPNDDANLKTWLQIRKYSNLAA